MDGYITIGTKLETKSFNAQIEKLERKLETLEKSADESKIPEKFRRSAEETRELNAEIEKTRNQLSDLYRKQAKLDKAGMNNMQSSLNNVSNSISKIIKKVTKWGLAIFGIRSMYMLVRRSMSELSQRDSQMATDLDYIRYALATALKPIIEAIINLVKQLLFYVGYLAKAWFNVNLFAKASAKDFAKSNKQAKDLKKTLAGFDEMNVLGSEDNNETPIPSFDLSDMSEMKVPKWLKWIRDNGEKIAGAIALIIGSKVLGTGLLGLTGLASTLATIGIIAIGVDLFYKALTGRDLVQDLQDIYNGFKDLSEAKEEQERIDKKLHESTVQAVKDKREEASTYEKGSLKMAQHLATMNSIIDTRKKEISTSKDAREEIKEVLISYQKLYEKGKLTNEQIEMYADLLDEVSGGASNFSKEVKQSLSTGQYTASFSQFANWWNNNIAKLDKDITLNIKYASGGGGKGSFGGGSSGGGGFRAKGGIFYPSKLPKLALGGIINNPGAGVPYNGAIIGERGAEAVVPLTDSQQMELLGSTIGKYITINATIPVYAYNRQVDKQIRRIKAEDDFAFNR